MDFADTPILHTSRPTALLSKPITSDPAAHQFPLMYRFQGQALADGKPCAHLAVLVEVVSGSIRQMKKVTTDAQGFFNATISLNAKLNDSVTWQISARTQDLKSAEAAGQNILLGESTIQVNQTLNLAAE
jgi:hypothetical protein